MSKFIKAAKINATDYFQKRRDGEYQVSLAKIG